MHIIKDNIYETEYYLTIINIIFILGFIDAKRCYFLTKTYKDIKYDWHSSKIIFQYKSMISSVNCEDGNICCRTTGRTCCSDPSVSKDEDIFLYVILIYTGPSYLHIIVWLNPNPTSFSVICMTLNQYSFLSKI